MNIQEYILDHWFEKMKPETPVLMVYDKDGIYYDLLPLAEAKGIKVIDTTKAPLHARLSAARFWCNDLSIDKDLRMIIYRKRQQPANNRQWVEEPFCGFKTAAAIFPFGPQDDYQYICQTFLPTKIKEIKQLFDNGSTSFNMINALLDGAAYPELEQLTGGKSFAEITVGLLAQISCADIRWIHEWKNFAEIQYPGLDCYGSTLQEVQQKLWSYLLFSEFVFDLPGDLPDSLKNVAKAPEEMKEKIYLVCDKLRNLINLREVYVKMADKTAKALNLADIFAKTKHLGNRITFCFENTVEYNRFIAYLKEGKMTEAHDMYEKNVKDVWYQENAEVVTFWNLAKYTLMLAECEGIESDGSLKDLINWYANDGQKADFAFRRFYTEKMGALSLPPAVKELGDLVNARYREFSERGVKEYQKRIKELKDIPSLRNQGCVEKIYPALKDGKRVVFAMVDAFRFEMGKAFSLSIERNYTNNVVCEAKVSYIPSITRFGMANHLADISIKERGGKLVPMIDGSEIVTPAERIDYLKKVTGVEVQDIRLEDFDPSAVNESTRLLVIKSTGIDVAGENDKLNGLAAMNGEMIKLVHLLDECRKLNFDVAYLVADHGFMLQPSFRSGDQINKPTGSDILLEESRMIAGNLNDSTDVLSFTPEQLGIKADVIKFCFAKNYTVFRRGEVYYHEGLSLQENVVPMISVNLQIEKKQNTFRLELKYKDKKEGTIYSRRPIIDINIYTDNLFSDDVNIRLSVTDDQNNTVGQPEGKFFDEVTQTLTLPSVVSKARQPLSINDEFSGDTIVITALDTDTNVTLSTLTLNFDND